MANATQTRPASRIHDKATTLQSRWMVVDHAGRDHEVIVSSLVDKPSATVFYLGPNGALGEEITTVASSSHEDAIAAAGRELDRLAGIPVAIGRGATVVFVRPEQPHESTYVRLVNPDGSDPALTAGEWRWLGGSLGARLGVVSRGSNVEIRPVHGAGPYAEEVEHVLTWADGSEGGARVLVSRAGYNTEGHQTYTVDALQPMRGVEWLALARCLGSRL
jgi:hypothetical protein